jgi:CBS domain-containing protein
MTRAVVTVPWKTKVGAFITDSLYPHHHDLYPVVREGRLVGYLLTRDVLGLPRETRSLFDIGKVMRQLIPTCVAADS